MSGEKMGPTFWLALAWLCVVTACAAGADLLPLPSPDRIDWVNLAAKPGAAGHLLGTDGMGRDILSRLLFGARVSLTVGLFSSCIGLVFGCLLGMAAGFYRGITERMIVGAVDAFMAFPRLIFLLMVMYVFGSSLLHLTLALGLVCTPSFARMARAATLKFAGREFVMAARAGGATNSSIILREILPNIAPSLLVYMLLVAGFVIIAEGGLGFLGLSVPSPTPSWGGMIADGREVLEQSPHVSLIPAAGMFLTILSVNLIGDRLRDRDDPREGRW